MFKIFQINEASFAEECNLRAGGKINLNFSCNDVVWSHLEEHLIATAATNGAVVIWNVNKNPRSKQETVFVEHKRTANKVNFHPSDPAVLISGSQDGSIRTFDLRTRECSATFASSQESIRDVQFSPHQPNHFAAVAENGRWVTFPVWRRSKNFCTMLF